MTPDNKNISARIQAAKDRRETEKGSDTKKNTEKSTATRMALRAGTDMVAAIMVGTFLGYWLDSWLGTRPWFMILLLFLGFAAGFLNIYRSQTGQEMKIGMGTPLSTRKDKEQDKEKDTL